MFKGAEIGKKIGEWLKEKGFESGAFGWNPVTHILTECLKSHL